MTGQNYRKPDRYHMLAPLSQKEFSERAAKRQRIIFRVFAFACTAIIGLQFL